MLSGTVIYPTPVMATQMNDPRHDRCTKAASRARTALPGGFSTVILGRKLTGTGSMPTWVASPPIASRIGNFCSPGVAQLVHAGFVRCAGGLGSGLIAV